MKIQNALVSDILDRWQRYFAHVTTMTLSWRAKYCCDRPRVFYTSVLNFHRISNSIEICLVGRAPGLKQKIWQDEHINLYVLIKPVYQDDDSHSLTLSDEGDVVVQRTSKFQISSITNAIDIIIQLKNNYLQPHLTKLDMKSAFRLPPPPLSP